MLDALVTLLAWKCARWGIDPLGRGAFRASNGVVENLFNICGHRDTSATDCPGQRTEPMLPTIRAKVAARLTGAGYWIATELGQVLAFGGAPPMNMSGFRLTSRIAGIAGHPSGAGYWLFADDGSVYGFGASAYHGGMHGNFLAAPIVGMAPTPSGSGYWLVGGDGGIFSFGDARFFGSTGAMRLNAPVLGMTPTQIRARAIGCTRATVASSASATRGSTDRRAASASTSPSSRWPRARRATATG